MYPYLTVSCTDPDDPEAVERFYSRMRSLPRPEPVSSIRDGFTCGRCRIRFAIREGGSGSEYTRCAEPGCGQRFWHGVSNAGRATVGVDPLDRPRVTPCVVRQAHHGKADGWSLSRQFNEAVRDAVEKSSVVHACGDAGSVI